MFDEVIEYDDYEDDYEDEYLACIICGASAVAFIGNDWFCIDHYYSN